MSKFLSLCNQLVSIDSTCKEPLPAGKLDIDSYTYITGLFRQAGITHIEWLYGMAVVGDGFGFEVLLQKKALEMLKDKKLSDDKRAVRAAGLAELAMLYIRGEKIVRGKKENTADDYAQVMRIGRQHWYKFRDSYDSLCDWCNGIESAANLKIWGVLERS